VTYHWKGFEENYNFVSGNTSIKIHMQKFQSNTNSNTFVPWDNLSSFSLGNMIVPQGKKGLSCSSKQLKLFLPRDMNVLREKAQVPQGNICSEFFCNHGHLTFVFI